MSQNRARGERHGSAKRTADEILEMRRLGRECGMTISDVAQKYCMSNRAAWEAMTGSTWAHLPPETVVQKVGRGGRNTPRQLKQFTSTEKYLGRRYIVAKVDLDKQVNRALMEFAQKLFDDHGVKLESAKFDWEQIGKLEGMNLHVNKINLETTVYR